MTVQTLEKIVFSVGEAVLNGKGVACTVVAAWRLPPSKLRRVADVPSALEMKSHNQRLVGSCTAWGFPRTLTDVEKAEVERQIEALYPQAIFTWFMSNKKATDAN